MIKKISKLGWADVTPKAHYLNRRAFMAAAGGVALAGPALAGLGAAKSQYSTDAAPNKLSDITGYSNYYEFGTDKTDPARYADALTIDPWSVEVDGLVERPGSYDLSDVLRGKALEERIYRLRCVEAWSMVVPWAGFERIGRFWRRGRGASPAQNTWPLKRCNGPKKCGCRNTAFWNGPTARGCGWTKPCTR